MTTWSFSRLKSFETCPKQFYHVTVLGEYPVVQTDAMTYGTAMHKAAEDYIGENKPLPDEFMYVKGTLDELRAFRGTKLTEQRLGLTRDLKPCGFKVLKLTDTSVISKFRLTKIDFFFPPYKIQTSIYRIPSVFSQTT